MFPRPDAEEALPSRATVGRPAATLQPRRPHLVRSLLSVRNWQQLGKFCVVGAVGYLINLGVYDVLLRADGSVEALVVEGGDGARELSPAGAAVLAEHVHTT